jgi:hypothetical protein
MPREVPASLDEIVAEAVLALGYFRVDSISPLTKLFEGLWPQGVSGQMLLSQREAANELLSEKGIENPRHAAIATATRIIFNVRRAENRPFPDFIKRVELRGMTEYSCSAIRQYDGVVVPIADRFELPLPDCCAEWCACRWDFVMD